MEKMYDIAIIGGGPAGLTSAIYGLRNGKRVLVVEKNVFGGQITNSPCVENIPGFKQISGDEYGDMLLDQVSDLGGDLLFDECIKVNRDKEITLYFKDSDPIVTKSLIVASGSKHRILNIEHEEELIGNNVHFCAVCDGNLYKDKVVCLIGGGNSALVEANLLANICRKLIILQDLPTFTGEKKQVEKLYTHSNIEVHFNTSELKYLIEDRMFKGISYKENNVSKVALCDGVFLAIGLIPNSQMFNGLLDLDERGYLIADELGKTKYDNIFVAGDCKNKFLRQVVTAQNDGAIAASLACRYLEEK